MDWNASCREWETVNVSKLFISHIVLSDSTFHSILNDTVSKISTSSLCSSNLASTAAQESSEEFIIQRNPSPLALLQSLQCSYEVRLSLVCTYSLVQYSMQKMEILFVLYMVWNLLYNILFRGSNNGTGDGKSCSVFMIESLQAVIHGFKISSYRTFSSVVVVNPARIFRRYSRWAWNVRIEVLRISAKLNLEIIFKVVSKFIVIMNIFVLFCRLIPSMWLLRLLFFNYFTTWISF